MIFVLFNFTGNFWFGSLAIYTDRRHWIVDQALGQVHWLYIQADATGSWIRPWAGVSKCITEAA